MPVAGRRLWSGYPGHTLTLVSPTHFNVPGPPAPAVAPTPARGRGRTCRPVPTPSRRRWSGASTSYVPQNASRVTSQCASAERTRSVEGGCRDLPARTGGCAERLAIRETNRPLPLPAFLPPQSAAAPSVVPSAARRPAFHLPLAPDVPRPLCGPMRYRSRVAVLGRHLTDTAPLSGHAPASRGSSACSAVYSSFQCVSFAPVRSRPVGLHCASRASDSTPRPPGGLKHSRFSQRLDITRCCQARGDIALASTHMACA